MRLDGRRQSNNVDDRRGGSRGIKFAGGGIGGVIIVALLVWISGGNPLSVLSGFNSGLMSEQQDYTPTQHEEELAVFARQILAGTEDVWTEEFKKMGFEYQPPRLVFLPALFKADAVARHRRPDRFIVRPIRLSISTCRFLKRWKGAWI